MGQWKAASWILRQGWSPRRSNASSWRNKSPSLENIAQNWRMPLSCGLSWRLRAPIYLKTGSANEQAIKLGCRPDPIKFPCFGYNELSHRSSCSLSTWHKRLLHCWIPAESGEASYFSLGLSVRPVWRRSWGAETARWTRSSASIKWACLEGMGVESQANSSI